MKDACLRSQQVYPASGITKKTCVVPGAGWTETNHFSSPSRDMASRKTKEGKVHFSAAGFVLSHAVVSANGSRKGNII